MPGNTHCRSVLLELLDNVKQKLKTELMIVRLDGGYLSGEILVEGLELACDRTRMSPRNALVKRQLQLIIACRYDWILSQGIVLDEAKWKQVDDNTRLYEALFRG